ncbi:MAG: CBS domain-containing protein [Planctomycetes bacterium]|nr:CBS domain-containing protein [Planctomycetota bacterium]MCB9825213.1 CBS domain-containing protein [Planctomycetota bacterium]MCB9829412.1 CBS domain-containing protein [Planctomycetota bacterium]MCB9900208.1 CBS domain-containing protein [Planctomycetota bacterium]
MGRQDVEITERPEDLRRFEERLVADADALERMLREERFETGARRIGLEQEFFLVDEFGRPAPRAVEVLQALGGAGSTYQNELALYNVEIAVPPRELGGRCFQEVEEELRRHMGAIRRAARPHGVDVVAIGILPTLTWDHLRLENMTPSPRYAALNRRVRAMRGGEFRIAIRGIDSLHATHDNVLLEAFNTSFQLHLQVAPDEFATIYNAMQLATGLALAGAGNSPLLLGARLWEETRIALFRQSIDTRTDHQLSRGHRPRVFFGDEWVKTGILDLVRDDIARFRVVLPMEEDEPMPGDVLDAGGIPSLSAWALHNGTIYRWNRPCYGVADGIPHLRIENRPLPAGPTALDSVANAAYLYGLTLGIASEYGDVSARMPFHDCQANFYNAASTGLRASLHWVDGNSRTADELVLLTLPLAAQGLRSCGVDESDVDRLLDVVASRVTKGQTGSRWMIEGFNRLRAAVPKDEAVQALTRAYMDRQRAGAPVHEWEPVNAPEPTNRRAAYQRVAQMMTTDLFTVQEEDTVTLAEAMMRWERIRHVPVENEAGALVGMLSLPNLLDTLKRGNGQIEQGLKVGEIMERDPVSVTPETPTLEAIALMKDNGLSGLPVVREGKLVGLLTITDFLTVAARLLEG